MHSLLFPLKKVLAKFFGTHLKFSFSQVGEDLIIKFIMDSLNLKKIEYLDIGANHPYNMNNTYLLYLLGSTGVCVEPNPELFNKIRKHRKKDICLNVGVGINNAERGRYHQMDNSFLSTFSDEEADKMVNLGEAKILRTISIDLININDLIRTYFKTCPDLISIDVEGIDFEIIKEIDFSIYRPKIFCIETISYSTNLTGVKSENILNLMLNNGYSLFADTYVNSIFVDKNLLRNEHSS